VQEKGVGEMWGEREKLKGRKGGLEGEFPNGEE